MVVGMGSTLVPLSGSLQMVSLPPTVCRFPDAMQAICPRVPPPTARRGGCLFHRPAHEPGIIVRRTVSTSTSAPGMAKEFRSASAAIR